jgi:hypothetical protein
MSALIQAKEALDLAQNVLEKKDPSIEGDLKGRRVRHWSFFLLISGAAIGVGTLIGAIIIGVYAIATVCFVLFATNSIGAFFIRRFDTLRNLEDYVTVMADRIKQLTATVTSLRDVRFSLEESHHKFKNNRERTRKVWQEGAIELKNKTEELAQTTALLVETQEKLVKTEDLYRSVKDVLLLFSQEVLHLTNAGGVMGTHLIGLKEKVEGLVHTVAHLDLENIEFDRQTTLYNDLNQANLTFLKGLKEEMVHMEALASQAKELKAILETKAPLFTRVSEDFERYLMRIEEIVREEKSLQGQEEQFVIQTKAIIEALKQASSN